MLWDGVFNMLRNQDYVNKGAYNIHSIKKHKEFNFNHALLFIYWIHLHKIFYILKMYLLEIYHDFLTK